MIDEEAFKRSFELMLAGVSNDRIELSYLDVALVFPSHDQASTDIEQMTIDEKAFSSCTNANGWELEFSPRKGLHSIHDSPPIFLRRMARNNDAS